MEKVIETIYNEVKIRCSNPSNIYGMGAWDHHIKLVYEIAIVNCNEYKADYNVVALAALLHDIASVTDKDFVDDHHIIGADMAGELLREQNVDIDIIEKVKLCILNHRGSKLTNKNSPEEICIADADAMAHFYSVPSLLKMVYVNKRMEIDEGADFVLHKLERSYNKLSLKGKKLVDKQYKAACLLLKNK